MSAEKNTPDRKNSGLRIIVVTRTSIAGNSRAKEHTEVPKPYPINTIKKVA